MNDMNSLQEEASQHLHLISSSELDEEPIVTSTSSPAHVQQLHRHQPIDTTITSPARITSSTGNDCSISPPLRQQHQQQVQLQHQTSRRQYKIDLTVEGSSEDDSRSQHEFSILAQQQQQQQQRELYVGDGVMPTTSSAAAATAINNKSQDSSVSIQKSSNLKLDINPATSAGSDMVARNIAPAISDSGGCGNVTVENSTPPITENHKIILKLPRPSAATAATESQMDVGPTTSNSSTNSSNNSSFLEDTRKVEPLKINLHHTHSTVQQQSVPKIIIKPIIKKQSEELETSCSSSADDDPPLPKLTIKTLTSATQHNNSSSEPHIVPKLTIRSSSGEEGSGTVQTASVVPRLTIKMTDTHSMASTTHNNMLSTTSSSSTNLLKSPTSISSSVCSTPSPTQQQPIEQAPLPKLTIKTSLDGTTNSIVSHISPASLSSSSTSSSSSFSSAQQAIPKLTIKNITKPDELVVPKLTIKTNAAGNSECAAATPSIGGETAEDVTTSKIPKLTIKTGQEHAVIITQHTETTHAQSVPKLTIKTKSLDAADVAGGSALSQSDQNDEPPPEKIPKITIKTNEIIDAATDTPKFSIKTKQSTTETETSLLPAIPKLTLSVSNVDCGGGIVSATLLVSGTNVGPQSPLVVRQIPGSSRRTNTATSSPERVPKLMISRQDSANLNSMMVISNHSSETTSSESKVVPKLTIKTSSILDSVESKDTKSAKFSIMPSSSTSEEDKIPKLTIKSMPPQAAVATVQQSSEDSDECVSVSSCSSPVLQDEQTSNNKVVPKLTIKNLSSPQPTVKTVAITTPETTNTASKKCAKNTVPKNDISVTANESTENPPQQLMAMNDAEETIDEAFATVTTVDEMIEAPTTTTTNGGESSSSQEFCGFNDNTTDSNIEAANLHEVEPRRQSDDMEIDETLQQQHEPQIFNNVSHFTNSNGGASDNALELTAATEQPSAESVSDFLLSVPTLKHPQLSHVIDTVDLTSSPSPGSSPAHFNYADSDLPEIEQPPKASDILLERLQQHREASVIQQMTVKPNNMLSDQLTNHVNSEAELNKTSTTLSPPPLQPKPANFLSNNSSSRYPHLAERLMANGIIHMTNTVNALKAQATPPKTETIVDSIEILDTPDGSPRSSIDEAPATLTGGNHLRNYSDAELTMQDADQAKNTMSHNNNNSIERTNHINLKRHVGIANASSTVNDVNNLEDCLQISPNKLRRIENESSTMATITILTNDRQEPTTTVLTTSPTMIQSNHCSESHSVEPPSTKMVTAVHRSRKQKHEHLLTVPIEEEDQDALQMNMIRDVTVDSPSNTNSFHTAAAAAECVTPITVKRRGRPRKIVKGVTPIPSGKQLVDSNIKTVEVEEQQSTAVDDDKVVKSRLTRVQLLRKRLAIDMVATEQPTTVLNDQELLHPEPQVETPSGIRRERNLRAPVRTSRRSATPITMLEEKGKRNNELQVDARKQQNKKSITDDSIMNNNHQQIFGVSSNSMSSVCSTGTLSSTTTAVAISMATQIDLTMSSSSSSNGSNTVTTVEAGTSRAVHSMLPPTTILSSSDPLADVIFRPNDFSSLSAAQQLRSPIKSRRCSMEDVNLMLTPKALSRQGSRTDSQDEDAGTGGSGADNSGEDSASSSSATTPGRGRGRGRGRSSGRGSSGSARGSRSHRLGRGASAVAKSIAMSRPRCVGGLKHTPDPQRIKGLFSPAPQVFEEDTRMSADLNHIVQATELTQSSTSRQLDFLTNEESQSSIISNCSILDPNLVAAVQNGAQVQKRSKKKKMEVCVADDTEFTVASIAEYDWPPPKGCCPSKNRDTFMIQEQVAMYLGITSFKRKYPDLPRRQVDMEERNWLQEKGLVSEKMCDLGITAVWASDVLDIMYTDFYEKYEEYKDFIRQKHVREIEAKQKALGLNVTGRGLQARDRAMLSASKWNAYFNKSRKDERNTCLDLQTLTVNVPLPCDAPTSTLLSRPILDTVEDAVASGLVETHPPFLTPALDASTKRLPSISYPLALVPGQYCEKYRHYTAMELRSYPVNTVLDDPRTLHDRLNRIPSSSLYRCSETDTESATETTAATTASQSNDAAGTIFSNKRLPVRRSRRARTNASASTVAAIVERTKNTCDTKNEALKSDFKSNAVESSSDESFSDASTSSASESSSSSNETYSDSESCFSSASEETPPKCSVCHRTQNRNLKDLPEVFIKCYTCRRKVHPSCIEMPHRMVARVRNYNWQCVECKCCIKCKRKQDPHKMLFCEQCDRGFHIYCLDIKSVPDGRWSCERCSVCMRCGATKPEGMPLIQHMLISPSTTSGQVKQIKHKKVKWINEYRIDHITKLREHCSMLCVPCGRAKSTNRRNNQFGSRGALAVTNSQMSPPPAPGLLSSTTIA